MSSVKWKCRPIKNRQPEADHCCTYANVDTGKYHTKRGREKKLEGEANRIKIYQFHLRDESIVSLIGNEYYSSVYLGNIYNCAGVGADVKVRDGNVAERTRCRENGELGWEIIRPTVWPCIEQPRHQHSSTSAAVHSILVISMLCLCFYLKSFSFILSVHSNV